MLSTLLKSLYKLPASVMITNVPFIHKILLIADQLTMAFFYS